MGQAPEGDNDHHSNRLEINSAPVTESRGRRIRVELTPANSEALDKLATHGFPPSWKVLTLQGSWDEDAEPEEVLALLQRHAGALGTLEQLGLPYDLEGAPVRTVPVSIYREHFLPAVYGAW